MSDLLTCTEPGSVPGQNCVDLGAAVCWLNWDWKDPPMNWVPADKERDRKETTIYRPANKYRQNRNAHHHLQSDIKYDT